MLLADGAPAMSRSRSSMKYEAVVVVKKVDIHRFTGACDINRESPVTNRNFARFALDG